MSESYETFKVVFANITATVNKMRYAGKITINSKERELDIYIGGDYKVRFVK